MKHLLVLMLAAAAGPQGRSKEAFDVARFVPPQGWTRSASPGLLMFQSPVGRGGPGGSALIVLFPSEPSQGSPLADFQAAWARRVAPQAAGARPPASPGMQRTSEGWTAVTGVAPYLRQGAQWRVLLLTAVGEGRAFSAVVHVLGNGFDATVDRFFQDLDLVGPGGAPSASPAGAPAAPPGGAAVSAAAIAGSVGDYVFTPPKGWTRTPRGDVVAYVSSPYPNTGERCELLVLPMLKAPGADLLQMAGQAFQALFKADGFAGYPAQDPELVKGISTAGWPYAMIRKGLGQAGDTAGGVIVFTAGLGDTVATIVTTSKAPLVSQCFGDMFPSEWPPFFQSLSFKNWTAKNMDKEMKAKILGTWTVATASVGGQYTFDSSGRYGTASAAAYTTRVSSTEIERTTYGFAGDGTWSIKGPNINFVADKGNAATESGTFRIEEFSKDGRTWKERLCILRSYGEVCYKRDR